MWSVLNLGWPLTSHPYKQVKKYIYADADSWSLNINGQEGLKTVLI